MSEQSFLRKIPTDLGKREEAGVSEIQIPAAPFCFHFSIFFALFEPIISKK